jgi:hypothetical protein
LKAYVQALQSERQLAGDAALAALGVRREVRPAFFAPSGVPNQLGETYVADGKRLAVVAQMATLADPRPALARRGDALLRIEERPRSHPVPVRVCGTRTCQRPARVGVPVRPVVVELGPGEVLGDALTLSYDFWWAQVSYARERQCSTRD